jgi:lysozyme
MHPNKTSNTGVNLVKSFEGLHKVGEDGLIRSYRCIAGRWTVGYGSTKGVRSGMKITEAEAEEKLVDDLKVSEADVKRVVNVPLSAHQFDALVCLAFNIGGTSLAKSTLVKKLNKGLYDEVPNEILRWDKARVDGSLQSVRGLTRRRTAEAALFTMDAPLASMGGEALPQKVEQTAVKSLKKSKTIAGTGIAGAATIMSETASKLEVLTGYSDTIQQVFLIITLGGISLAAYARYKDSLEGVR